MNDGLAKTNQMASHKDTRAALFAKTERQQQSQFFHDVARINRKKYSPKVEKKQSDTAVFTGFNGDFLRLKTDKVIVSVDTAKHVYCLLKLRS